MHFYFSTSGEEASLVLVESLEFTLLFANAAAGYFYYYSALL